MRLGPASFVTLIFLLAACAETPRCVERGVAPRTTVEIECNAGKVAVCGTDSVALYQGADDPTPGALRPVPPEDVASGSCDGLSANCRTRPICGAAGEGATCADGTSPVCVRGVVTEIMTVTPRPDAGTPTEDDAGTPDAGDIDAGDIDAGDFDAG
jgi:hypothetical protein